jgi:hypothetical protein
MSILAAFRPDSWDFPLLVHIVGVVLFVGGVVTAAAFLGYARGDARLLRLGYWTLLALALPGYVVLRIGGEWLNTKYNDLTPDVDEPTWLNIGYIVADLGALLLLAALIAGGIGIYRLRDGKGTGLLKATLALSIVLVAAGLVAVWAMAGKPT